jgi:hypothetical protein
VATAVVVEHELEHRRGRTILGADDDLVHVSVFITGPATALPSGSLLELSRKTNPLDTPASKKNRLYLLSAFGSPISLAPLQPAAPACTASR